MRQKLVFDKKKTRFPEPSVRKISYNIGILITSETSLLCRRTICLITEKLIN